MKCNVDSKGWCARHKTHHVGRLYELSQDETHLGASYRALWDSQAGIPINKKTKIRLICKLSPGDALILSSTLESVAMQYPDQYTFSVQCCCPEIFDNNPHCSHFNTPDKVIEMHYPSIHRCNQSDVSYLSGYVIYLADQLKIPLYCSVNRPYIYFSKEELAKPRQVLGKYAVLCAGGKQDYLTKQWGHDNWQKVVDWIIEEKRIQVAQVGLNHHIHKPLKGTINLLGKTNTRELFLLANYAEFCLSHESYLHHIAAAIPPPYGPKPAVVCASSWNPKGYTAYNTEILISRQGTMPCNRSGGCFKSNFEPGGCPHPCIVGEETIAKCMYLIKPEEIINAIQSYYDGGILS